MKWTRELKFSNSYTDYDDTVDRTISTHDIQSALGINEDFKIEIGPTDKAKEPDPGGSDQQNLGFKKTEKQKN